jgi:hypothetical protein
LIGLAVFDIVMALSPAVSRSGHVYLGAAHAARKASA